MYVCMCVYVCVGGGGGGAGTVRLQTPLNSRLSAHTWSGGDTLARGWLRALLLLARHPSPTRRKHRRKGAATHVTPLPAHRWLVRFRRMAWADVRWVQRSPARSCSQRSIAPCPVLSQHMSAVRWCAVVCGVWSVQREREREEKRERERTRAHTVAVTRRVSSVNYTW